MVMIIVMIMVNVVDAKAKLSEYLEAVARGERVVICNRNRPVAELRPVAAAPAARRLGTAAGEMSVRDTFNDPLPDEVLDAFEGRDPQARGWSKPAQSRGTSPVKRKRRG